MNNTLSIPLQHIYLDGQPLYYRQHGQGTPLLWLHGWGASSGYWLNALHHFGNHYTSYAPELPGYGNTPPTPRHATVEELAQLLIAFADAHHIGQFDVNGHSFGGAIAIYLAVHYPQRVRRLIVTCFGIFGTPLQQRMLAYCYYYPSDLVLTIWKPFLVSSRPVLQPWQRWCAAASCNTHLAHELMRPFFHNMHNIANHTLCDAFRNMMHMDIRTSLAGAVSLANPTLTVACATISVPTLVIGARNDTMVLPTQVHRLYQVVPKARIAWLDACGHLPMIECPEPYYQVIERFLA